jgi:CRP/FNR family transcriptional regulator, dissimilatory nitrate respiration regulator
VCGSKGHVVSILVSALIAYDLNHMLQNNFQLPPDLQTLLPQPLHAICKAEHFKRNTYLFKVGKHPEWMFYVLTGEVTLERMGIQGDPVVLQRTRHGFVSEASLQSPVYHCDAHVVADAEVVCVPVPALLDSLAQDSAFALRWIGMCNREIRHLRLQCERMSLKTVQERLLHLIETEGKSGLYDVGSGLKTLASELGVTHEALYRTLALLEKEQKLTRSSGYLSIK